MKMKVIFQFIFPKSICIEPAIRFQAIQSARFAKAGVPIHRFTLEQKESLLLDQKAEAIDTEYSKRELFVSILELISKITVDFASIIPLPLFRMM